MKGIKSTYLAALVVLLSPMAANAGVVVGGDLLDSADADQLEIWLGVGDSDFTNIWDGTSGDTAASWHQAVDGVANTISIYDITYAGSQFLIGGYRDTANSSTGGWSHSTNAFIFNLTTGLQQTTVGGAWGAGQLAYYDRTNYFATFGGGHDIWGGYDVLGNGGYVNGAYTYGGYNVGAGNILGSTSRAYYGISINGLETYTYAAAAVPEPGTLALFGLGLAGIGFARRKKV